MKNRYLNPVFLFIVALAGFVCVCRANAQNVSADQLIEYARTAARGQATEQQQAILFANNDRLNHLAMAGKIADTDYQYNQRAFVDKNDELIRKASSHYGLAVAPAKHSDVYKAGTDTDRQLQNNAGKLTVDHVKNVRNAYNREVNDYIKAQGVKVATGENWAKKLATDIMPSPRDMKPADFKTANSYINSAGGLAYTNATAAKIQLQIDGAGLKSPALHEAEAYHAEMQNKIKIMNDEIKKLGRERASTDDSSHREELDIEIRKRTAYISKYIDRDNKIADLISKGKSDTGLIESSYSRTSTGKIKQAQSRDAAGSTLKAEAHVAALSTHLAETATRKFNDAIAGAAIGTANADKAAGIIAGNLKNLSLSQQTQAIADLKIKYGDKFAAGVSGELKKNVSGASIGSNLAISKGLGLANTALSIGSQYAQGKSTGEILWNMSIGSTLETVNSETAAYTAREIERLKQQYRAAGEDPESIAVKLKIMTAATVKGTFYGSAIGSYDLLKSATNTAACAAIAAADSAIFLAGEALDTRNVLEQAFAEIQAQNMEQSVQNAKAVRFGKDALAELKRLADEAAYFKSLLEQNARSARLFCRACDNALDDLKADLREINALKETDLLKTLPATEKQIAKNLAATENSVQNINKRAEAALRALAEGKNFKEALQAAQTLTIECNACAENLEKSRNEMCRLGDAASLNGINRIVADFETRKAKLIEQSVKATGNSEIMRKNEAQYKKTVAAFASLKAQIYKAETFFAQKRQSMEGDWMVIKSRIHEIAQPDGKMPEAFFGEVGTLERLPDNIAGEIRRMQPPFGVLSADFSEPAGLADLALQRLTPAYHSAAKALATLKENINALRSAKQPEVAAPTTIDLICPSTANVGEAVNMRVALPPVSSADNSAASAKTDPFGGHDPQSPEGMLALMNYKRTRESSSSPAGHQAADSFLIKWEFGDGTATGKNSSNSVSHTYKTPGRYTITVSVYSKKTPTSPLEVKSTQITIHAAKKDSRRLPCGHLPGECPKEGIQAIKCRLHSGKISERKD